MVPVIGTVRLPELRRRDVRNVTDKILGRGSRIEANRVFEDVRTMVQWAVQNEYLDANPLDAMDKPAKATARTRVLSDDEIKTLWQGLPVALAKSVRCQRIIKICLVTGQRIGEIAGMTRAELDLKAREWRLPGTRTKNAHAHVVPLSDLAIDDDAGKGQPIFPCGNGSLSPVLVANTIRRANVAGRFGIG